MLYRVADWSSLGWVRPAADSNLYVCDCSSFNMHNRRVAHSNELEQAKPMFWRCGGHPRLASL